MCILLLSDIQPAYIFHFSDHVVSYVQLMVVLFCGAD